MRGSSLCWHPASCPDNTLSSPSDSLVWAQSSLRAMYSLIPDHLGFLLKREEAKHEVDSKLASHCAALARHTVHVQPRTEATE